MQNIAQYNTNHKIGHILVVDDEAELMNALCETLAKQGYETAGFLTGEEALAVLKEREFDLLLTDLMMPGMDGIALIRAGLEIDPNLIGIIMTGHGTVQTAVEAMKTGAFDYILKPFKLNTLLPLLSRAMQVRNLRLENLQLKETVAIHELGKAISFSSDLNSILNKIADTALQQCSADEVSIMLPTKSGHELYVAVVRGGRTENLGEHAPIEQGIAGWVARNRELVVFRGEVNDQRMAPIRPRNDIHTAVSMPMLSQSKLVGVLNVNITKSHRQFTLGQLKALSILVSIIAPILENTSLYIQIRKAEEEYRSIFENIHEGIFRSLDGERFIAANPALARIFGYDSAADLMASITDITRQIYANPDDAAEFARIMGTQKEVRNFECQACRKNGSRVWISVGAHTVRDEKGAPLYNEGTIEDITERKSAELQLKLAKEILETLNRQNDVMKLISDILHLLKENTGIEAVGIRLREGEDYPYYATSGFSGHFLEAEHSLCAHDDAGKIVRDAGGKPCLEGRCGNVLSGLMDTSRPYFTAGGSFWTNSTTQHLTEKTAQEYQGVIRNRCHEEGYESLALIPLRSGNDIIGLLQLSDTRPGLFTSDMVRFFEGVGASIGIAVARRLSVERLRESEERLRDIMFSIADWMWEVDENGVYTYSSQKGFDLFGKSCGDIIGKKPFDFMPPDEAKRVAAIFSEIIANKAPIKDLENWSIGKDGKRICFLTNGVPILDKEGNLKGYRGIDKDITERKQTEEWLLKERSMVDRIMKTSPAGITVVNTEGQIVFANTRAEVILGLAKDAITKLAYDSPAWRITDFDGNPFPDEQLPFAQVMTTGSPVYGIRHTIASPEGRRLYLSVNGAPIHDEQGNINQVVLTIDDITKSRQAEEKIAQTLKKLRKSMQDTIKAMSTIVETRDPYTAGHQDKVSKLAVAIANELHLSEAQIGGIQMAGSIHDIGKISVPAEILSKPGRLSDIEFRLIKVHPEAGYEILKDIEFSVPIAEIVLQHHERIDGSGYPRGLTGEDILIEARTIAVADTVDAIASHRPYRVALGLDAALAEIEQNKGIIYDAAVADACLKLFREKGFQLEGKIT